MIPAIPSARFRRYVRELRSLNAELVRCGGIPLSAVDLAHAHLNGRASRELRAAVDIADLRRIGAFFTGEKLADALLASGLSTKAGAFIDPACGCGDLLLGAARTMETRFGLDETLANWGTRLFGTDLVPEFVDTTRERLMLLALSKGAKPEASAPRLDHLLPGIRVGDGRTEPLAIGSGSVLLNPPYGQVIAPARTGWGSGRVTEAALWVDGALDRMPRGMRLAALLPDVLRSGSRYAHWRARVGAQTIVHRVEAIGQFDALTDVDVFLLVLERADCGSGWAEADASAEVVGDIAQVWVGPVVDRRDPHEE